MFRADLVLPFFLDSCDALYCLKIICPFRPVEFWRFQQDSFFRNLTNFKVGHARVYKLFRLVFWKIYPMSIWVEDYAQLVRMLL